MLSKFPLAGFAPDGLLTEVAGEPKLRKVDSSLEMSVKVRM
jgi:hypothetical protein